MYVPQPHKYRKCPVVIEAFQMTEKRRWDNSDWPVWLHRAWQLANHETGSVHCRTGGEDLFVVTLEGELRVPWDHWIIKGVEDELYPCEPDIFRATYEAVDGSATMDAT